MPTADDIASAALVALECFSIPVFILAADTTVAHANQSAAAMLGDHVAFRVLQGRLALRRAQDREALVGAVARVAKDKVPDLLRFRTRPGEANILVRLAPVPGTALVVVCVNELRESLLLQPGWSRLALGFTPQKAQLAEALANGQSLAEFAAQAELPIGTVRTRLKKLLAQPGLSSQAALVALLLRGASLMG